MQVKAHYEGIAEGLMAALPAGGSLAADALATLQAASTAGAAFDIVQQRSALRGVSTMLIMCDGKIAA